MLRSRSGFSLIEVLVVVSILAVVMFSGLAFLSARMKAVEYDRLKNVLNGFVKAQTQKYQRDGDFSYTECPFQVVSNPCPGGVATVRVCGSIPTDLQVYMPANYLTGGQIFICGQGKGWIEAGITGSDGQSVNTKAVVPFGRRYIYGIQFGSNYEGYKLGE